MNYSFSYSLAVVIAFLFLYFILPVGIEYIVGDDFFIYSSSQNIANIANTIVGFILFMLLLRIFRKSKISPHVNSLPPDKYTISFFFYLNLCYFLIIFFRGLLAISQGMGRMDLLLVINSLLLPGYGYLLLLASVAVIHLKKSKLLLLFVLLSFLIDFVYNGKIFSANAVMVLVFYLDNARVKFSFTRILLIGLSGFGFIVMIFLLRAISSGVEDNVIGLYSFFSEFMGVNASVGWSYEYLHDGLPMDLFDFGATLQNYYENSVGFGLALNPAAYFVGNFGSYYFAVAIFYAYIVYLIYCISSSLLGRYALFVLMYDLIHLLRHGPDVFILKFFTHSLFLVIVLLILKNHISSRNDKNSSFFTYENSI
jgi:hypothetical protein